MSPTTDAPNNLIPRGTSNGGTGGTAMLPGGTTTRGKAVFVETSPEPRTGERDPVFLQDLIVWDAIGEKTQVVPLEFCEHLGVRDHSLSVRWHGLSEPMWSDGHKHVLDVDDTGEWDVASREENSE
ncbi:hypothetical protein FI667_g550, partial [Globisporangium splendens]